MSEERLGKAYLYPAQIWKAQNKSSTMSIEDHLSAPLDLDKFPNTPPLMMHTPFSRFRISILDKAKPTNNHVACNIRPRDETAYLCDQYKKIAMNPPKPSGEALPPAYTCKFAGGNYTGKTPADVLINDPNKAAELRRTQNFLKQNLSKYPNNQKMIDAIDNAISLLETGELAPRNASSHLGITIFEKNFKLMEGNTIQASICISYNPNMNTAPWKFTIGNADVESINGDNVSVKNHRTLTYYLSPELMSGFIDTIKSVQKCFENANYERLKDKANAIIRQNIENYHKNKNS